LCVLLAMTLSPYPGKAATNTVAALPNPEAVFDEANAFFAQYKQAARQVREKHEPEAVLTLSLLLNSLKNSPWMEVALLKQSELSEIRNERFALDNYQLLLQRVQNSPYYQRRDEKAKLLGVALEGAVKNGINRIRARRLRVALDRYFGRYHEYPQSLAKLSILGYTDMENIHTVDEKPFRYIPTGQQMTPFLSYKRYEGLETLPTEPFLATTPKLEGTSRVSDEPVKYAALIRVARSGEVERIIENQTVHGFIVLAIAPTGVIICNDQRILVLLPSTPEP